MSHLCAFLSSSLLSSVFRLSSPTIHVLVFIVGSWCPSSLVWSLVPSSGMNRVVVNVCFVFTSVCLIVVLSWVCASWFWCDPHLLSCVNHHLESVLRWYKCVSCRHRRGKKSKRSLKATTKLSRWWVYPSLICVAHLTFDLKALFFPTIQTLSSKWIDKPHCCQARHSPDTSDQWVRGTNLGGWSDHNIVPCGKKAHIYLCRNLGITDIRISANKQDIRINLVMWRVYTCVCVYVRACVWVREYVLCCSALCQRASTGIEIKASTQFYKLNPEYRRKRQGCTKQTINHSFSQS